MNNYVDGADDIRGDIPNGWWLLPPSKADKVPKQSHYLLAVLVHKNNADIVSDPIDAAAGASRETGRKKAAEERTTEIALALSGKREESMMLTKAKLMKQNIELQETEGIEKQLNLLERFKPSFVNTSSEEGEQE